MRIRVIKPFKSRVLGECEPGQVVECDDLIGDSIIGSRLGEQMEEIIEKPKRKRKSINRENIETGAMEIETA